MKEISKETIDYIEEASGGTVDQFCLNNAGILVDQMSTELEASGIPLEEYRDNLIIQSEVYKKAATIIDAMLSLNDDATKH